MRLVVPPRGSILHKGKRFINDAEVPWPVIVLNEKDPSDRVELDTTPYPRKGDDADGETDAE